LIFVRSKSGAHLSEALHIAEKCWPVHLYILGIVKPACILCFDRKVWDFVAGKGTLITPPGPKLAGHANWTCLYARLRLDERELGLLVVPHSSRYAVDQHPDVLDWIRAKLAIQPSGAAQAPATDAGSSAIRQLQSSGDSRSIGSTSDIGIEMGSVDPKHTIVLLDRLVALGFSNEAFPNLHHLRDTIHGFRRWCLQKSRFAPGKNNERVHLRLAYVLKEFAKRDRLSRQTQVFTELAQQAMKTIPPLP
jgi:hypothetical protein